MAPYILMQVSANTFLNYLVLGYAAMWLIAFAYVVGLAMQQQNIRRDIALLKQLLETEDEQQEGV